MTDPRGKGGFGAATAPAGGADRPLVTFALFAYNQEDYIREAVEGAFAQTYSPLEIILSDDCSADRTFEIMQEMAAEYRGPHQVRVRRSEVNFGTALHVQAVSQMAQGALLIVAAGDDISFDIRSEKIVEAWVSEGKPVACLHSAAFKFQDNMEERVFQASRSSGTLTKSEQLTLILNGGGVFLSPTCAYSGELFQNFDPLIGGSIIEDGVMAHRSLLAGTLIAIAEPLVLIRTSPETAGTGYSYLKPNRWNRFVRSRIISYMNLINDIERTDLDKKTGKKLQRRWRKQIRRLSMFILETGAELSLIERIVLAAKYFLFYPTGSRLVFHAADALKFVGFINRAPLNPLLQWIRSRL